MKRGVLVLLGVLALALPAQAQTPYPPAEQPDDGCTSIPQLGGCEEEDDEEIASPAPSPSADVPSTPAAPSAETPAAPVAVAPPAAPVVAPVAETEPESEPGPEVSEEVVGTSVSRTKELPAELAYTGSAMPWAVSLMLLLIAAGVAFRYRARRVAADANFEELLRRMTKEAGDQK